MATATDDNAEIKNLDARLFKKSTCWYTNILSILIRIITVGIHLYSILSFSYLISMILPEYYIDAALSSMTHQS